MSGKEPEKIIEILRQTVINGKFGVDYTIIPRDKNNELREKFLINDYKVKTILLSLSEDDFIKTEKSTSENFPNDIVHIFKKNVSLIQRYTETFDSQIIKLYIKFTWTEQIEFRNLIIISFHQWNEK